LRGLLACRTGASGLAATAAAFASSSGDHRTLMPSPQTAATETPNQPEDSVNASTPPSEWPSTTSGPTPVTASATVAVILPNE
jgi:hypothetical protein